MKHKIRNQLLLRYIFLTIIPVMVLSVFMLNTYSNRLIATEEASLERNFEVFHSNVSEALQDYLYMIDFLQKDKQIQDLLKGQPSDGTNISLLLNGYSRQLNHVMAISILDHDGEAYSSVHLTGTDLTAFESSEGALSEGNKTMIEIFGPGQGPLSTKVSDYVYTVHLISTICGEDECLGYLDVMVSTDMFEEAAKNIDMGNGGYYFVGDEGDRPLYSPVASNDLNKENSYGYLTRKDRVTAGDWTLHVVKPIGDVLEGVNALRTNLILMFFVSVLIMIAVTALFSNSLVKPIRQMQALMKDVEKGNLDVRFEDNVKNEVHDLGMGFNKMIGRINVLIDQVKEEQHAKRATEIAMLQSNIKPHFIYNSLETIRWMSKKYKADDISETVSALASFFRVGLSKGKEEILLSDEILHVRSYLQIQHTRYSDIMTYSMDIPEVMEGYHVPKMILQPFVENALYHGIKESGEEGSIRITGRTEDGHIILTVEDDGRGMTEERLQEVLNEMHHVTDRTYISYGVKNVHQRIELIYGKPYGVQMTSKENKGTKVTVTLPIH